MKKVNGKITILYARLSQEDKTNGVSNSIENQRKILEQYAEENGFTNCVFKFDDGVSGTTFDRPAWNEVMEMIEDRRVETLIIKDTSRLGRNYWKAGELIEDTLPMFGVRFISIGDNADSDKGLDDFMPFRTVMHDLQAKETSKKVKTVKKSKAERGERIGSKAPYGYMKDPENPTRIKPDEDASVVVKLIYSLCIAGHGPKQIANQLEDRKILNPTNYYYEKTGATLLNLNTEKPYKWSHKTVARIIEDDVYLGHTTSMRTGVISYKNKKKVDKPKEEWIKVYNTHQAIIEQEEFDLANRVREQKRRKLNDDDKPSIFSGMLFCSDCNKVLNIQRYKTAKGKKISFRCSTNRVSTKDCSSHSIAESLLMRVVLDDMKRVTHFARTHEELFRNYIHEKSSKETLSEIKQKEKEIAKLTKRNDDVRKLLKKLYEDNVSGKLSDENFETLTEEYDLENSQIKEQLPKHKAELEQMKSSMHSADRFIEQAKRYTDMKELSSELLRTFIDKIVVGEKEIKNDCTSPQDIWIHYREIGLLDDEEHIDPRTVMVRKSNKIAS